MMLPSMTEYPSTTQYLSSKLNTMEEHVLLFSHSSQIRSKKL